jgi:2-polyprenyl-6-methoxyphenol hydroxylase-like FAD-dependent oxidoreductase
LKNKVLISGSGIAGLTLGWWLKKYKFDPKIIEIAPARRKGGYMIDFWGIGYDVAEKMEIIENLKNAHYNIPKLVFVDEDGDKVGTLNIQKLRKRIDYRHFNLLRSDLEKILYNQIKDKVKIQYSTSIKNLKILNNKVQVELSNGTFETYDYVIGADGLHSNTRNIIFGPEHQFEKFMGYYTASYTIDNFLKEDRVFQSHTIPKKQVAIYTVKEDKLASFFVWKSERLDYSYSNSSQKKKFLKKAYEDVGWKTEIILNALEESPDFYFDSVSQIEMDKWYKDRVVLVGDACQCVSLISGQGSGLAMAGAYILAGEMKRNRGNHEKAFNIYQEKMKPEIIRKQEMAQDFASSFVPESKFSLWVRNKLSNIMTLPILYKYFVKRFMSDNLVLENY